MHIVNRDLEAVMPNIVLQVKTNVKTTLQEIGAIQLFQELETLLEGQIRDLVKPEHKIRHLISKYNIMNFNMNWENISVKCYSIFVLITLFIFFRLKNSAIFAKNNTLTINSTTTSATRTFIPARRIDSYSGSIFNPYFA